VGEVILVYDEKGFAVCETQVKVENTHITLFILLTSLILGVRKFSRPFLIF
jgi:hypothetical protein